MDTRARLSQQLDDWSFLPGRCRNPRVLRRQLAEASRSSLGDQVRRRISIRSVRNEPVLLRVGRGRKAV